MKLRARQPFLLQILTFVFTVTCVLHAQAGPLYFRIKLDPALGSEARSGRLIIFLSSSPTPTKEIHFSNSAEDRFLRVEAREIDHLDAGATVEVNGYEPSYPAPLAEAPAGDYQAMALLDVTHRYVYNNDESGDVRSEVVPLKQLDPAHAGPVDLTLTIAIPEKPTPTPGAGEMLDFESPALSAFWGRPIHMRGVVVLPPDYEKSTRRYPTVYWTHGYGGNIRSIAERIAPRYAKAMADGDLSPMIYVLLDESCPGGTHEFADSANNGPWGTALTTELIPYLEKKYRMTARSSGRFLTGHSSGGWAALWLQVSYPKIFGGTWPTSPDPSDFHAFTGPDLRATPTPNFYHDAQGKPWPLVRINGQEVLSLEDYARQEYVLGAYGGQIASFEWVFSPRAKDGTPEKLFNRATGVINPEVAIAWEKYDIAEILRRKAAQLRPLLQDKIHLTVGTADTFHLEAPAHLLDETMKQLGIRATFTYLPGKTHFDLYDDGLMKQIGKEMEAVAAQGISKQGSGKQSATKNR